MVQRERLRNRGEFWIYPVFAAVIENMLAVTTQKIVLDLPVGVHNHAVSHPHRARAVSAPKVVIDRMRYQVAPDEHLLKQAERAFSGPYAFLPHLTHSTTTEWFMEDMRGPAWYGVLACA